MFSSRLPESLESNQFAEILAAKKIAGVEMLDLTLSNPTIVGFAAGGRALNPPAADPVSRYQPSPQGLLSARRTIADYYRHSHQATIEPDDLILTASTSEAYSYLFKLLTDPGDEVLVPAPGYPLFDFLAQLDKADPVRYPLKQNHQGLWRIDFPRLEQQLSTRTRAIIAVHPNNPTGSLLTASELHRLDALCRGRRLALIVDEVFLDYPGNVGGAQPFSTLAEEREALTFVLSGFSKVLALPQAKLSWIHVGGPARIRSEAKQRLEFIADSYLSVNGLVQHQAGQLLAGREQVQREIRQRLTANEARLHGTGGLESCPREGGWYAIIRLPPGLDDEECSLELLKVHNLVVHPGFFYDFREDNSIVVSLLCPEELFAEGLRRLENYFAACSR